MKLSSALILASVASSVSASKSISGKTVGQLLKGARRIDEQGDDNEEGEYDFLAKYTLKMIGCRAGEQVINQENGEVEYSAAIVRLCPSDEGCSSDSTVGCKSGHGDYILGLSSFVESYFKDQEDNMQWDDNFDVDRYSKCEEYEMEQGDDDANANQAQYYIGPTCADDGLDVKLAVFDEYTCSTESTTTFAEISNGWTLPYADGGIVSTSCIDCVDVNDDGEYEIREMCEQLKEEAAYSCEQDMEYFSYYGQNNQGCEYIEELLPKSAGGAAFGWFVFFCLIGGSVGYTMWWRKKKSANTDGLVA